MQSTHYILSRKLRLNWPGRLSTQLSTHRAAECALLFVTNWLASQTLIDIINGVRHNFAPASHNCTWIMRNLNRHGNDPVNGLVWAKQRAGSRAGTFGWWGSSLKSRYRCLEMEKKLQLGNVVCVDYQCFLGSPTRYHNTRIIIVLHAHFAVGLDVPLLLTLRNPNRPPPVVSTILHKMPLQVSLKEYPNFYFPHKNPIQNDKTTHGDGWEGR